MPWEGVELLQGAESGSFCSLNKNRACLISSVSSLVIGCTSSPVVQLEESAAFLARSCLVANKNHCCGGVECAGISRVAMPQLGALYA